MKYLLIVVSILGAGVLPTVSAESRKPNILFIMTDQQRWDCVGVNGNELIKTPNLDRLGNGGANFSHAFVVAPVCVPSRISFFTGRYPHAHRNRVNYTPLDRSERLIQGRLQEAGYQTAVVGKLHYHPPTAEEAKRTGFDIVELHDGTSQRNFWSAYVKWRQANDPKKAINFRAVAKNVPSGENPFRAAIDEEFTDTAWTGARARHHIEELAGADKPFFLHVSFWKPHSPYEIAEPWDALYNDVEIPTPAPFSDDEMEKLPLPMQKLATRGNGPVRWDPEKMQWIYRSYYGAISQIDHEVGLILKTLETAGLSDNTIIVFTSDHGDQLLEHGINGKNCFFESSVRVPLMVNFPGRIKSGRYENLIESIDVMPTLFELIGLPEPLSCQGRSFAPLISDSDRTYESHDAIFSENIIPEVITGGRLDLYFEKGKGVDGIRHPDAPMVRTERWKYNHYPDGYAELYDLQNDPGEDTNLADREEFQPVIADMRLRLLNWLSTSSETDQIAPRWLLPEK